MLTLLQRIIELLGLIYQVLSDKQTLTPIPIEEEVWLNKESVMDLLCITRSTFYRRRDEGNWITKRSGKETYYLKSSLYR
ncbi:hypothetical protein ACXZ1K_02235 [Pedobacter sp. PWIIR3]